MLCSTLNTEKLESKLNYTFTNRALLQQALTHCSVPAPHNERLEFLGDAVLSAVVAELVFEHYPTKPEGHLSRIRSQCVCEAALATFARELELSEVVILGPGEVKNGGAYKNSILADTVEALVGAIFLDTGWEGVRTVVRHWISPLLAAQTVHTLIKKDAKTELQEWLQAKHHTLPIYQMLEMNLEQSPPSFKVSCTLALLNIVTEGIGATRKEAEQNAAQLAWELACQMNP